MIGSLRDVKQELKPQAAGDTSNDAYLLWALESAEARFTALAGFDFVPQQRVVSFRDADRHQQLVRNGQELVLRTPLLAVTSLTNGTAGALEAGEYRLLPLFPDRSDQPYGSVVLVDGTWARDSEATGAAIVIDGTWGYHTAYDAAWLTSGDCVQDDPLAADAPTVAVTDADGADAIGVTPRFSPGQLIQIDSEWLAVQAVNTTTNTLTVRRGVGGSTASEHAQVAAIHTWQADRQAVRAVSRWVALHLTRRGAFDQLTVQGFSAMQFPPDAPEEVMRIVAWFRSLFDPPFLEV